MRIKQLILNGFKSFPEKTVITFDPNVNAIVGPNGCGKTNVLDGLRWVMGEASFTQMRCAKTEDLIFSGNRAHPPVNYAEVALILENNEESSNNNQPLYNLGTEIEVKRRFFRSGESEFYINRKPCKLKDIQDLFTSGGGSGHTYSIFDLPTMRQIIGSNLKDLFIEAAGLAFYQERKDEIERKLKLTSDDVIRLNDIITERTRITRSLKRQAYRLMAFEKVKEQERKLQVSLLKFDYKKICSDETIINDELNKLQNEASALEQKNNDAEHRRAELRKVLQEKEGIRNTIQQEIDALKEQIIINEERLKANLDKQNLFKGEQTKLQSEFAFIEQLETNKNITGNKKQYLEQINNVFSKKEQEFEDLRHKNKTLEAEIFSDQLALDELSEKDKQLFIRFSQLSSEFSTTEMKIEDTKRYLQTLVDSLSALTLTKSNRASFEDSKIVLKERLGNNYIGRLKEMIVAKPGFETALDSVLFGIYDAITVNSLSDIPFDNIPKDRSWIILAHSSNIKHPIVSRPQINIGRSFNEVIELNAKIPDYIKSIIDSFILIEDYTQIQSIDKNLSDYSFVTKSGIALTNSGLLIIPQVSTKESLDNKPGDKLDEKIKTLSQENEIIENNLKGLGQNLNRLAQEKKDKEKDKQETSLSLKQKQETINQKRKQNKENLDLASNLLFDLNKRREEITRIKAELDEITRTEDHRDSLFADRQRVTETIRNLSEEENSLRKNVNQLQDNSKEKKLFFDKTEVGLLSKEYDDLELQLNESRVVLDIQKNNIANRQLKKFEIVNKREQIEKQVAELLPNGLEMLTLPDEQIREIDDIKKELGLVQKRIIAIGLINPLAKDDYEREKIALDKLVGQRTDIQTAQNNLTFALSELTKKAEEMFLVTYQAVQVSFRRIFKEIFLEGEADIILETPNTPLASEIKIIAQPRGKVPKRLDQLSDGEKALLALSLLFAFYDIKPAPFCFMDEVDAPLDDANVKRFTQFLKRISQTTQIIIITHNKLTVEAATVVIGVTTEEVGISKIVSVRFKDIPAFAKA